jgi:hypothetical protein
MDALARAASSWPATTARASLACHCQSSCRGGTMMTMMAWTRRSESEPQPEAARAQAGPGAWPGQSGLANLAWPGVFMGRGPRRRNEDGAGGVTRRTMTRHWPGKPWLSGSRCTLQARAQQVTVASPGPARKIVVRTARLARAARRESLHFASSTLSSITNASGWFMEPMARDSGREPEAKAARACARGPGPKLHCVLSGH